MGALEHWCVCVRERTLVCLLEHKWVCCVLYYWWVCYITGGCVRTHVDVLEH